MIFGKTKNQLCSFAQSSLFIAPKFLGEIKNFGGDFRWIQIIK
jgi:hypothetical protein